MIISLILYLSFLFATTFDMNQN